MKRYKMDNDYGCGYGVTEIEDPEGEWVRHENINILRKKYEKLLKEVSSQATNAVKIGGPDCNCEIKSKIGLNKGPIEFKADAWWMCPAHGYKRL